MSIISLKKISNEINETMPWLYGIIDDKQYQELLALMDELVEDYDENKLLIDLIFPVLERYEEQSEQFKVFNKHIQNIDQGIAMLRVIIDQYSLTLSDFENEIGKKSLVSMILSGKRSLTLNHIRKLAARFDIPVAMFV